MSIPADILLARALSHLERATLELQVGNVDVATEYIHKGVTLVEEAIQG